MKRRDFIKTSLAASSLAGLSQLAASARAAENSASGPQEYYEWRTYQLKSSAQKDRVEGYLANAFIPALNRMGCKPIGSFTLKEAPTAAALHVLIPYPSLDVYAGVLDRLAKDDDYQKAASDYLQAPKSDPSYERIESSLMLAFAGMPRIELPPYSVEKKTRMFELRIYEAHSEFKCQKKVQMFNNGEMQVMRETGMAPVFYGYTLIGTKVPNMTYMLSAENKAEHDKHWKAFGSHPEWKRLQTLPEYQDTVSHITNYFLEPTAASQI